MSGKNTVDQAIYYCQCYKLFLSDRTANPGDKTFPYSYGGNLVRIGDFLFDCHAHSTGNSVRIFILGDDSYLEIVNTTYWHSSSYTHNDSKWLHGAWDGALDLAIEEMWQAVAKAKAEREERNAAQALEKEQQAGAYRAKFEHKFTQQEPT
jgi:hypothetical protein